MRSRQRKKLARRVCQRCDRSVPHWRMTCERCVVQAFCAVEDLFTQRRNEESAWMYQRLKAAMDAEIEKAILGTRYAGHKPPPMWDVELVE